ncbi:Kelch repeat-containing protein, partial [Hyalangium sp.]|uniref:Kelch repeat-containing protein n=1 Tax=Hyalangium sp. TaxID=2028555 RepID=UPI002D54AD22
MSALVDGGGTWSKEIQMDKGRSYHAATLLLNGKVLITGGVEPTNADAGVYTIRDTELYDPATGRSSHAGRGEYRFGHTATLLHDGRVLVAGGFADKAPLASAEIYDPNCPASPEGGSPASDGSATCITWTLIKPMQYSRAAHTATLLRDGRVLVVGGVSERDPPMAPPEVYDPTTGEWTDAADLGDGNRAFHTATLLPDGKVLVLGGVQLAAKPDGFTLLSVLQNKKLFTRFYAKALDSAALYIPDPQRGTWTHLEAGLTARRVAHTATLMPDGKVLVVGGWDKRVDAPQIALEIAGMR